LLNQSVSSCHQMRKWTVERLQSLVADSVGENRSIEYKLLLPSEAEEGKREYLNDVSSFANSLGGALIYGVKAEQGKPVELPGLDLADMDATILRLDQMLQNSVEPRIQGIDYVPVILESGKPILVLEIPQSVAAPHMVRKGSPKFYTRGAAGKYPMDVHELRSSFAASEGLAQKVERFLEERLSKVRTGQTPEPLADSAVLVFHLLPAVSFTRTTEIDVDRLPDKALDLMRPIMTRGNGWGPLHCLEGFAKSSSNRDRKAISYSLLFRNGAIEGVDAYSFGEYGPNNHRLLRPKIYESELRHALTRFGELYDLLGIPGPYFVSISLLGVKGLTFYPDPQYDWSGLRPVATDDIILPQRTIQQWSGDPDEVLKPLFDLIWNACGLPWSRNYDGSGRWNPSN
jgi:hypothetical protein